jgi:thiol-disulfide isomerase/thioredoxin
MSARTSARKPSSSPDRRKLVMYGTLALVVIAIVVAVGLSSRVQKAATDVPISDSKLKPGDTAPAFSIATNEGNFDLSQVSTPVLLEVFATWCPHCQHETVVLNDIAGKYAGKLAMVAASGSAQGMDGSSPETQNDVNAFGEHFNVRYPIAFDPQLKVAQLYIKGGFPTLVLIDKNKQIRWMQSGEVPEADLVKAINGVL